MRYEVLGPVQARLDDVVVAVGGPQQRRLLALLLSQSGQSVSSQRLVDCLWPDGLAPDGAGRSVMTYVSRLRAALGESSISTVEEGYRLELGDGLIDSQQFESLLAEAGTEEPGRAVEVYDRALALWRGSAYGDFGAEWWLLAEANRLNEMRTLAKEERAEAILAMGHHHRVIPELERLVTDEPLRERPTSLLMQALFTTGRHADALRAFQSFRTRLADETGLDPSDDLVALERSMASGKPIASLNARARLLRGYSVHEVLGEGASGRVFAATQPGTNREVAIKAIRPDLSDTADFIQRFEAEAQLVARLETQTISASISFPEIACPDPYCGTIFESEHRLWIAPQTGRILTIDKDTMHRIDPTLVVDGINYVSGSSDGDRVVVSSESGVLVFDGHSGDRLGTIEAEVFNGTSNTTGLAVAPGGRVVAATVEGDLFVYDLETRNVRHTLSGTRGSTEVAVSRDGRVAMATGLDHSVSLYDVPSGEQIGDRMIIPETEAVAGAVRPDGKELAIGGGFGRELLVWDLDPEHWVTAACKLARRNLTPDEWDTYVSDLGEYRITCPEYQ